MSAWHSLGRGREPCAARKRKEVDVCEGQVRPVWLVPGMGGEVRRWRGGLCARILELGKQFEFIEIQKETRRVT